MATEEEIRVQKERLSKMSSDAIRGEIPTWKPYAAGKIAGEIILEERKKSEEAGNKPKKEWHEKMIGKYILGVLIGLTVFFVGYFFRYITEMKKGPNQAPEPTPTAVTPPARQEARQP
jgi:hypothetical protein